MTAILLQKAYQKLYKKKILNVFPKHLNIFFPSAKSK